MPELVFASPRALPKPDRIEGRVAVLDIAFAAAGGGVSFEAVTLPFIQGLDARLAAWVDHHDHERHVDYADDSRFVLATKAQHGACPEMVTRSVVHDAGPVDTIVCHMDLDGLYSAAKWILAGKEPYPGADDDARCIDTRTGTPGPIAIRIDHALRARFRDLGLKRSIVLWLVGGMSQSGHDDAIEAAAAEFAERAKGTETLARGYVVRDSIAYVDTGARPPAYDKTDLLLHGQSLAAVAVVHDSGMVTIAAGFDSGWDFVALLGLDGGMPTRVTIPETRLEEALAAVQVRLELADLASPDVFRARMLEHGARAAAATADAEHRLVVFPENLGHFALLAFAPDAARRRSSVEAALAAFAATRPMSLARALWTHRQLSLKQTAMLALSPAAQDLMHTTFAEVARRCRATVVAGSMLRVRGRRVANSSATFGPGGQLLAVTDKVNLVPDAEDNSPDGLGLVRGDADALPVVDTPWGSIATLICYDGFRESHTRGERFAHMGQRADRARVDVIANPSANPWPWDGPWFFAEAGEAILRRDQWRTEGLPAMLAELAHTRYGVTAHLAGTLLDQAFEGRSEILERTASGVTVLAQATTIDETEVVVAHVPKPG